jgi:signal peptidase I
VLAREILSRGRAFRFLARGASMSPFIRDGDVITLVPFDPADCMPGAVVAYARPDTAALVVHRVVAVAGDRCRIQGDNNLVPDGEIPCASIIGTVSRVERAGRPVRFGLGPERSLIALLSRRRWLRGCMSAAQPLYSTLRRFFIP